MNDPRRVANYSTGIYTTTGISIVKDNLMGGLPMRYITLLFLFPCLALAQTLDPRVECPTKMNDVTTYFTAKHQECLAKVGYKNCVSAGKHPMECKKELNGKLAYVERLKENEKKKQQRDKVRGDFGLRQSQLLSDLNRPIKWTSGERAAQCQSKKEESIQCVKESTTLKHLDYCEKESSYLRRRRCY